MVQPAHTHAMTSYYLLQHHRLSVSAASTRGRQLHTGALHTLHPHAVRHTPASRVQQPRPQLHTNTTCCSAMTAPSSNSTPRSPAQPPDGSNDILPPATCQAPASQRAVPTHTPALPGSRCAAALAAAHRCLASSSLAHQPPSHHTRLTGHAPPPPAAAQRSSLQQAAPAACQANSQLCTATPPNLNPVPTAASPTAYLPSQPSPVPPPARLTAAQSCPCTCRCCWR